MYSSVYYQFYIAHGILILTPIYFLFVHQYIPNLKETVKAFGILQAARVRTTKTEFVSCPGCGRTLLQLHDVVAEVKKQFSHLTHLKIGVMGCIVNGPGEMGDVDYGYVGAGPGKVSLYKGHEVIKKNIPSKDAIHELTEIIKSHGDWIHK